MQLSIGVHGDCGSAGGGPWVARIARSAVGKACEFSPLLVAAAVEPKGAATSFRLRVRPLGLLGISLCSCVAGIAGAPWMPFLCWWGSVVSWGGVPCCVDWVEVVFSGPGSECLAYTG